MGEDELHRLFNGRKAVEGSSLLLAHLIKKVASPIKSFIKT